MKTRFVLECSDELGFVVLGLNSHVKNYKLCWSINKELQLNLEKKKDHNVQDDLWFARFNYTCPDGIEYNLLSNRSKKGYLLPSHKSVNYFMVIKNDYWQQDKDIFMEKLRAIENILLVFELDTSLIKNINRFVFNDKKD